MDYSVGLGLWLRFRLSRGQGVSGTSYLQEGLGIGAAQENRAWFRALGPKSLTAQALNSQTMIEFHLIYGP